MTNCAELNYILEKEPDEFLTVITTKRTVYIWEDKRTHVEQNGEIFSWTCASEMTEQPNSGFMEIWETTQTNIPTKIDNKWDETYKSIIGNDYVIEWHTHTCLLRIIWFQNLKSLKETKLLGSVVKKIDDMGLEIPIFPTILV